MRHSSGRQEGQKKSSKANGEAGEEESAELFTSSDNGGIGSREKEERAG